MAVDLPVSFDGERIEVGSEPSAAGDRIERACPHGTFPATVLIEYGPDGTLAHVVADCLTTSWATHVAGYVDHLHPLDPRPPATLRVDARTATLHWTDTWRDPDEDEPASPGQPVWHGVDVDLVEGRPAESDYDDFFPFSACQACSDEEGRLRFGVCIGMTGRIHGLFLEAPASDLPVPANSTRRTVGAWPLL